MCKKNEINYDLLFASMKMAGSQWLSYDTVLKSNNNPISTVVNHDTDDFLLNILSRRREATVKESGKLSSNTNKRYRS